jgi:hypothetical protein
MKSSRKFTAAGPRKYQPDAGLPPREMKTRWFADTLHEEIKDGTKPRSFYTLNKLLELASTRPVPDKK